MPENCDHKNLKIEANTRWTGGFICEDCGETVYCKHEQVTKEVIFGHRTGDFVCVSCGKSIDREDIYGEKPPMTEEEIREMERRLDPSFIDDSEPPF